MSFYHGRKSLPRRFRLILTSVLQTDGLPFADVLGEQEIQDAFDEHNVAFAQEEDGSAFVNSLTNAEPFRQAKKACFEDLESVLDSIAADIACSKEGDLR